MKTFTSIIVSACVAMILLSSTASAELIGVNFTGSHSFTDANVLNQSDPAGIPSAVQQNWNAKAGSYFTNGAGPNTTENYTGLVNSTGAGTSVTLTANYTDSYYSNAFGGGSPGPDNVLLNGVILTNPSAAGTTGTLTWNNVVGPQNVIVYLAGTFTEVGNATLTVTGQSPVTLTELGGNSDQANPVTYTNVLTGANYYEFTNVSPVAGAIALSFAYNSGNADSQFGVAAVQLQTATPEPGSFVLFGIAGVGLLAVIRRRRRQA